MPDKHEVGGSSPLEPTIRKKRIRQMFIENRIKILKRTDNFFKILKSGFSEKEIG